MKSIFSCSMFFFSLDRSSEAVHMNNNNYYLLAPSPDLSNIGTNVYPNPPPPPHKLYQSMLLVLTKTQYSMIITSCSKHNHCSVGNNKIIIITHHTFGNNPFSQNLVFLSISLLYPSHCTHNYYS